MASINQYDINYVVSDLHLAEGDLGRGLTLGTENFFADKEFAELIHHLLSLPENADKSVNLVINGDFVDFIRISIVPKVNGNSDLSDWQNEINLTGIDYKVSASDIDKREKQYGLKTNDYKCIWKLYLSIKGHQELFESLALWVSSGNYLTIIVGNHDPEWFWPLLQTYFTNKLQSISESCGYQINNDIDEFKARVNYSNSGYEVDDKIWIEHGHNYQRMTKLCPKYTFHACAGGAYKLFKKSDINDRQEELYLPMGSFFNRYLINKVEIIFPYVDNITSHGALFNALIKEDVENVFKILGHYGAYTIKIILKYFWSSLLQTLLYFLVTVLPFGILVGLGYYFVTQESFLSELPSWLAGVLKVIIPPVAGFLARYLMKKLLTLFGLRDKPLPTCAFNDMKAGKRLAKYHTVFLGHNHDPQIIEKGGKQYVNTGTWTKKYVLKYKRVQSGTIYSVAKIERFKNQPPRVSLLQWKEASKSLVTFASFKDDLP